MTLGEEIWKLGSGLIRCPLICGGVGITNKPEDGIVPRCLILETPDRSQPKKAEKVDCAVIGINPGRADKEEKQACKKPDVTYKTVVDFWYDKRSGLKNNGHKYYRETRKLLESLKLTPNSSILWTELCKCQTEEGWRKPPLQTFRTCIAKYLNKEISLIGDVPLIGLGDTAYRALSYLFPKHLVIGVPHPTGSYGHWKELNEKYIEKAMKEIRRAIKNKECVRLFPKDLAKLFE